MSHCVVLAEKRRDISILPRTAREPRENTSYHTGHTQPWLIILLISLQCSDDIVSAHVASGLYQG